MRVVVQRVSKANVQVEQRTIGSIDKGLLIFLGIEESDTQDDSTWLVRKILNMRIFEDEDGKMNHSVLDAGGKLLVISQFTLHASTKKGNRPSFIKAARPEKAEAMYHSFVAICKKQIHTETGSFGAMMDVSLVNDGPVTIIMDSKNRE
jgi:D-tyrosyl-tRNA(Tyr) deacylase